MDLYQSMFEGTIDLDDLSIYPEAWRCLRSYNLWLKAEEEAGESLFYMQFMHPPESDWGHQVSRVHKMCRELADMRVSVIEDSDENRLRVMKWLYRFEDEVENQV